MLTRNLGDLSAVAADKGYDWEEIRTRLRAERITLLITQRHPGFRGWGEKFAYQGSGVSPAFDAESVFFELRRKYGETLWARTWFGQYREIVMKSAVRNIERAIEGSDR